MQKANGPQNPPSYCTGVGGMEVIQLNSGGGVMLLEVLIYYTLLTCACFFKQQSVGQLYISTFCCITQYLFVGGSRQSLMVTLVLQVIFPIGYLCLQNMYGNCEQKMCNRDGLCVIGICSVSHWKAGWLLQFDIQAKSKVLVILVPTCDSVESW